MKYKIGLDNLNIELEISLSSNKVYLNDELIFEFSYTIKDKDTIPYIELLGDLMDVYSIYYVSHVNLFSYTKKDIENIFNNAFLFSISKTFNIIPKHTMICIDSNNIDSKNLQLNNIQTEELFTMVTNTSSINCIYYFKI
jgi:hypothetical protein